MVAAFVVAALCLFAVCSFVVGSPSDSDDSSAASDPGHRVPTPVKLTGFWPTIELATAWIYLSNHRSTGDVEAAVSFGSEIVSQYDFIVMLDGKPYTNDSVDGKTYSLSGSPVGNHHSSVSVSGASVQVAVALDLTCGKTRATTRQSIFACLTYSDYSSKRANWERVNLPSTETRVPSVSSSSAVAPTLYQTWPTPVVFVTETPFELPSDPAPETLPEYRVDQVLEDYESNEARANAVYQGKRFVVSGGVHKVRDDGVEFYLGDLVFVVASASFRDRRHLLSLDAGQDLSLVCTGGGFSLDFFLEFLDCTVIVDSPLVSSPTSSLPPTAVRVVVPTRPPSPTRTYVFVSRPLDPAAHVYDQAVIDYLRVQVSTVSRELTGNEIRDALALTDDAVYLLCVQGPEASLRVRLVQAKDMAETQHLLSADGADAYELALSCLLREGELYRGMGNLDAYDERVASHLVGAALPLGFMRETDYYGIASSDRVIRGSVDWHRCRRLLVGRPVSAAVVVDRVAEDLATVAACADDAGWSSY